MKTRICRLFTLLLLLFMSCQKEEGTLLGKVVLEKVVFHENADQVGYYHYAKTGQVQRYEYFVDKKLVEYVEYGYTGTRLTSKNYYQVTPNNSFKLTGTDMYAYGPGDKLVQITTGANSPNEVVYTFSWQNNQVNRIDTRNNIFGTATTSYQLLEYDQNGNAVKITAYTLGGNTPELHFVLEQTFDTKPNPFYTLTDPREIQFHNPNNLIKSEQRARPGEAAYATNTQVYTYTETGLPQEVQITYNSYGQVSGATTKFYHKAI